jgi:hypothetical protein
MNENEKIEFVKGVSETVLAEIIGNIKSGKVPKTWEGKELRAYLADKFYENYGLFPIRGREAGTYENDKLVNNL